VGKEEEEGVGLVEQEHSHRVALEQGVGVSVSWFWP
jgi:hypothetical protein